MHVRPRGVRAGAHAERGGSWTSAYPIGREARVPARVPKRGGWLWEGRPVAEAQVPGGGGEAPAAKLTECEDYPTRKPGASACESCRWDASECMPRDGTRVG